MPNMDSLQPINVRPAVINQTGTDEMMVGVKVASTANIASLSGAGGTIDGQATANGWKILVWKQTSTTANGIYKINTSGAWTKLYAFDSSKNAVTGPNVGMVAAVATGTLYGGAFIQFNGGTSFIQMSGVFN